MNDYVGLLGRSSDVWGVVIPDLPGIHGGVQPTDAAIADAISAFREVARIRAEDRARRPASPCAPAPAEPSA